MSNATRFQFPLAKAEYLLTYKTASRVGGDKQNFLQKELGFESAEAILPSFYHKNKDRRNRPLAKVAIANYFALKKAHNYKYQQLN